MDNYLSLSGISERPTSSPDFKPSNLEEKYGNACSSECIKEVTDKMTLLKKTDEPTGWWPLDVHGGHTWRDREGGNSKNAKRDFAKWAQMALIEIKIVSEYREIMFKKLPEACQIRAELLCILDRWVHPRNIIVNDPVKKKLVSKTVCKYFYPDGITITIPKKYPDVDIDEEVEIRNNMREILDDKAEIEDIVRGIEKKRLSAAVPGGKLISKEVYECTTALVQVSAS
jgi:hypothetical protein